MSDSKEVVIIAVSQYDNLGAGYLSSVLSSAGFRTSIISPFRKNTGLLRTVRRLDPLLIGFSVIFQYHIDLFRDIAGYLRSKGINCHFTAGGHYASLKSRELFELMPDLDSIVRFEGEYSLKELVNCLHSGSDWRKMRGISYRAGGNIIENRLRPLEKDLDSFPYPFRGPLRKVVFERKMATIIAGRGCTNNCSFCNVRKFYSLPPGPVKRIRKPEKVVDEMRFLHKKKNCTIFFFLDDDFPLRPEKEPDWVMRFCDGLNKNKLSGDIMWKICCRPDEIDRVQFELMKRNGLFRVFLGIEDGTDRGLKRLNKNMNVAESLKGIRILRDLEIDYDYGFMLFQPHTTFRSLEVNIGFLGHICENGCTPVTFLKLMPYYDTKVERELADSGRLKISGGVSDYDFPEDQMNGYYRFITDSFSEWLRHPEGVANLEDWGMTYYSAYDGWFGKDEDVLSLKSSFKKIVSDSNRYILNTLTEVSQIFESGKDSRGLNHSLQDIKQEVLSRQKLFTGRIRENLGSLLELPLKHFFSRVCPGYTGSPGGGYVIRS